MVHTTLQALYPGEGISVAVLFTPTMLRLEIKLLELLNPPGNLPLWVIELLDPAKRCVVCAYQERLAQQERAKMSHEMHQSQEFPTGGTVVSFRFGQCVTAIDDNAFNSILIPGQDSTNSLLCVQDEGIRGSREGQDRS